MLLLLWLLHRGDCQFLGSRSNYGGCCGGWCWRWGIPIDRSNVEILDLDLIADGGRDDLERLVTLVVHVSQRIVELEVRVGNGAGAEEDWDSNGGTHLEWVEGGRVLDSRIDL